MGKHKGRFDRGSTIFFLTFCLSSQIDTNPLSQPSSNHVPSTVLYTRYTAHGHNIACTINWTRLRKSRDLVQHVFLVDEVTASLHQMQQLAYVGVPLRENLYGGETIAPGRRAVGEVGVKSAWQDIHVTTPANDLCERKPGGWVENSVGVIRSGSRLGHE